ncbi:hypothetical protein [Amycolatopsis magusensis]|uniref:Polymer-forming protein n=1 Tax=Amycolatopsis magusensis TaxID=882444 RepID=A0ABS4Q618_9PSEU|nr:hypothetical protein [Amycolatopsis magusensis]MBP2186533.1 hypothetical protein [Amycolatopsis magusensis]MDI5978361.1 hypothetical protein [Amycolatopsis magusensis]
MFGLSRARSRSLAALTLAAASSSLGLVALATPASAGFVTFCEGSGGAVTVPGELRVATGKSCVLDGTRVTGSVTVEPGANLVVTGGTFDGGVAVQDDGFFDAQATKIAGDLVLTDAYGTFVSGGPVGGNVKVSAAAHPERSTYAFLSGAEVAGDVTSTVGEVYAENSEFAKSVTGTGVSYLDLTNSVIGANLSVTGATLGSVFCGGEVYGNATYTGNSHTLQIGADGPVIACAQASYWGGNVTISDNTADVRVSNNIIRGNLAGTGNAPAPTGADNRVRGTVSGQFENLSASASGFAARSAAVSPEAEAQAKVDQRRSAAENAAAVAGPAQL